MKRPTTKEMLTLIKRLPDAESHIYICCVNGKHCVIYIAKTRAIQQERFYLENEIQ